MCVILDHSVFLDMGFHVLVYVFSVLSIIGSLSFITGNIAEIK